jgi:hypothetical protein
MQDQQIVFNTTGPPDAAEPSHKQLNDVPSISSLRVPRKLVEEKKKEQVEDIIKKTVSSRYTLDSLTTKAQRKLFRIKSVFPFMLFPDELIIDESKINVVSKLFFASEDVRSVPINNIAAVSVETSIFFASLRIVDKFFRDEPLVVTYLHKDEAIRARRIIEGLLVIAEEKVDLTTFPPDKIVELLEKIGTAR